MINWGWNSKKNTSNSEYGRGAAFAAQKASFGSSGSAYNPQMNAPYFSVGQEQFTPGHVHAPSCPNYGTGQASQAYAPNQNWSNYSGAGDQPQFSGGPEGGIYSTGGNSATDFEVLVGDAAINAKSNATAAASGQSGDANQPSGQPQQHQYNVNYYMPNKSNESEAGAGTAMNYQMSPQALAALNQQQFDSKGFGLPSENGDNCQTNSTMNMTMASPKGGSGKYGKPRSSRHRALDSRFKPQLTESKFRLCGSCKKCRELKDCGSAPSLFPSATNLPQRRRNVNYVPNPKYGRNLAPTQLPSATPILQNFNPSQQHHRKSSSRRSSVGGMSGYSTSNMNTTDFGSP